MKKKIILAFIISGSLIVSFSSAQTGLQVMKPKYILTYESASVLEVGIDNVIRITVSDSSVKRILVNASQGTVKQKGENFIVHPVSIGEIILKIYNNNEPGNPVFIEEKKMDVVASPFATLAGKQGGNISREELKQVTKLEVSGRENTFKVTQFKLSVTGKDIEYKEFNSKDENLTEEMIAQLQQLPAGAKIYVEYIRAGAGDGSGARQIAPLSFTVVE